MQGGESEIVIGNWMQARGNRDQVIVATKVGSAGGLSSANVRERTEASLRRLQTDYIDLLYAHKDDPETALEETLSAFGELVDEGKVRYVAASNYDADRLAEALAISARESLPRYEALQPHYNLVERKRYEGELSELCASENVLVRAVLRARVGLSDRQVPARGDDRHEAGQTLRSALPRQTACGRNAGDA